jgi:hypothetical protein
MHLNFNSSSTTMWHMGSKKHRTATLTSFSSTGGTFTLPLILLQAPVVQHSSRPVPPLNHQGGLLAATTGTV